MNPGPLRRLVGSLGLLALAPIAVLVVLGRLDLVTAAQRALIVLVVAVVLGRLVSGYLRAVAVRFDVPRHRTVRLRPSDPGAVATAEDG